MQRSPPSIKSKDQVIHDSQGFDLPDDDDEDADDGDVDKEGEKDSQVNPYIDANAQVDKQFNTDQKVIHFKENLS